jgi:Cu/Zn superoxide dismutase
MHVHETPLVTPDCTATGGHFKSAPDEIHGFPQFVLPQR